MLQPYASHAVPLARPVRAMAGDEEIVVEHARLCGGVTELYTGTRWLPTEDLTLIDVADVNVIVAARRRLRES